MKRMKVKRIFITDLLDIHIVLCMLDLILNPNDCLSPAQADTEQTGKLCNHKDRIIIPSRRSNPAYYTENAG